MSGTNTDSARSFILSGYHISLASIMHASQHFSHTYHFPVHFTATSTSTSSAPLRPSSATHVSAAPRQTRPPGRTSPSDVAMALVYAWLVSDDPPTQLITPSITSSIASCMHGRMAGWLLVRDRQRMHNTYDHRRASSLNTYDTSSFGEVLACF